MFVYCRYPKVRESWSNEATQKLGRAIVLQVPKIYGMLVYCRYPKVRESWFNEATRKLGTAIVL